MTDNDIIKALERMSEEDPTGFSSDILALINRQKVESDYLKRDVLPRYKDALRRANKFATSLDKKNQELRAEIERLKDYNENLIAANIGLSFSLLDEIKAARDKTIKEFTERLCEGRVSNDPVVIAAKCLEKEMTDGER